MTKRQQITVREIADIIRRPHEEMATVVDRIRGWADVGLLKVQGDQFPGTGKKRLYGPGVILDAVILTALTDAGLAAVRVGHFAASSGMTVLGFGRLGACELLDPAKPEQPIFLIIAGPGPSPWNVMISDGETKLNQLPANESYSIILNLNDYFRPLRGIVTAVMEHGRVKIQLATKE
jgi:hypothetical protein